jgi:hypothetical protein
MNESTYYVRIFDFNRDPKYILTEAKKTIYSFKKTNKYKRYDIFLLFITFFLLFLHIKEQIVIAKISCGKQYSNNTNSFG